MFLSQLSLLFVFMAFVFLFGLSIGSFINMAAFRIPIGLSIVKPRSYCNNCKKTLDSLSLTPVIGYLIRGGKCRHCRIKIPAEYPLVEIFVGVYFCLASYLLIIKNITLYGLNLNELSIHHWAVFFLSIWIFCSGLVLSLIDLRHRILPDLIVIPGCLLNIIISYFNPFIGITQSLIGFAVGFFGLLAITKLYEILRKREAMGFGDIKYMGFIGAALGPLGALYTLVIASVIGSLVGIAIMLLKKENLSLSLPFGPFLAFGAILYFWWSHYLYFLVDL